MIITAVLSFVLTGAKCSESIRDRSHRGRNRTVIVVSIMGALGNQ